MRGLQHQLLLLCRHRLCDSSSSGASSVLAAAPAAMQALKACSTFPTPAQHNRAGQSHAPCNTSAEAAARLAHQQHSRLPAQHAGSWHTSSPLSLALRHRCRAAYVQCSISAPRTRRAGRRQLHSSTAGQAAAPAGIEADQHADLQHAAQRQLRRGYQQQLHSQAAGFAVPGLALAQHISPIMLSHQGEQTQQAQQEQEQQDTQHGQQHAGAGLSQQQLRSLPQEVLLVGIDPDCSGAIAVVRSPLHWSLTPAPSYNGSSTSTSSSKRPCTKQPARSGSSGDGNSSDAPSSSNSSSNGCSSNGSSSSTAEVPQLQAFMGLPAVRVYDMPVETIVTKTKTSTGKRRVRRRLDILQAMAIVRQVLQDAAEEADSMHSSTAGTTAATSATAFGGDSTMSITVTASTSIPGLSSSFGSHASFDTNISSTSSSDGSSSAVDAAVSDPSSSNHTNGSRSSSRDGVSGSHTSDTGDPTRSPGSSSGDGSNGSSSNGSSSDGGGSSSRDGDGSIDTSSSRDGRSMSSSSSSLGSSSSRDGSSSSSSRDGSSSRNGSILLRAVVEVASLLPTNGSLATLNQGYSVGAWTALLASHGFDVTTVHVMSWKKDMGLLKRDKDCSRELAREIFRQAQAPQDHLLRTKNTHGRAEALLLAAWGLGWGSPAGSPPTQAPLRATVHMDGGRHSLPLQHHQQQPVPPNSSPANASPAAASASASGILSDDEQVLCSQLGLHGSSSSSGMPGAVSRRHIAQRLQPYAEPGRPRPPPPPRILDVREEQEEAMAEVMTAFAEKMVEKELRAMAKKQAAADRAAAKAREKEERAAARAAKAAGRAATKAAANGTTKAAADVRQAEGEEQGEKAGAAAAEVPARRRRRRLRGSTSGSTSAGSS